MFLLQQSVLHFIQPFDETAVQIILKDTKTLKNIAQELPFEQAETFLADVWLCFFTDYATIQPNENDRAKFLTTLLTHEVFLKLHQKTVANKLLSTLATIRLNYILLEQFKAMSQDDNIQQNEASSSLEHLLNSPQFMQFEQQFSLEAAQIVKIEQAVDDLLKGLSPAVGGGDSAKMPLQDKLALAERLQQNAHLQKIANWAGKFKLIAHKKQKKKTVRTMTKKGRTTGNKAERLLPIEFLKAESPEAQLDFFYRLSENRVQMYDYKMRTKHEKGAFIVCYDESSSMEDLDAQGKGFVLALMGIAKKEKRDFVFIPFSGDVSFQDIHVFKKGQFKTAELIAVAESYIGGGTNFQAPLLEAQKHLLTSAKGGDIIFITDGACHIDDAFITQFNLVKKQKDFEMLSLIIGRNKHPGVLPDISNEIIKVVDFMDDESFKVFEV